MFNLETAISTWKRALELNPSFRKDDIEELERHIRDVVASKVAQGLSEEEGYRLAIREIGDLIGLETEYKKVYWDKVFFRHGVGNELIWEWKMFIKNMGIAFRNLWRNKGYSFINLIGLAVGLACVVLIGLFVQDELSYDRHNEHADSIVRAIVGEKQVSTPTALGPTLGRTFPEVVAWTRVYPLGNFAPVTVRHLDKVFQESGYFLADSSVFDVFTFVPVLGEVEGALNRPQTIVLTESAATKYFGEENPIGQVVQIRGTTDYEVTLVIEDLPSTSHVQFDMLASFVSSNWSTREIWNSANFFTYLRLSNPDLLPTVQGKIDDMLAQLKANSGAGIPDSYQINLQKLTDIRLRFEGRQVYVIIFSAIGLLILLVACANYTNLATARASRRAREVGIRKISGAYQAQLARQFFGESVLLVLMSMIIGIVIVYFAIDPFNAISGKDVHFSLIESPKMIAYLVLGTLAVGLIAGSYPALVLSSFQPATVLKASSRTGTEGLGFRRVLVVFQFSVTVFLLVGMFTVNIQLDHVRNQNLGFDKENVVVLSIADSELRESYQTIKDAFLNLGSVSSASAIYSVPGHQNSGFGLRTEESGLTSEQSEDAMPVAGIPVDSDVVETLGLRMVAGSSFNTGRDYEPTDGSYVYLFNESMVRALNWTPQEAIGKKVNLSGNRIGEVVGVYEDYHFLSLHSEIQPQALFIEPSQFSFLMLKVSGDRLTDVMNDIETVWSAVAPGRPFDFQFLDDVVDELYRADRQVQSVVTLFSVLAVLIACLGLLGLASYSAEQRTKEIGIRKALGASVNQIFVLMISELTQLVLISVVIAVPVSWYILSKWLDNFAYRIDMSWWIFVVSGLFALILAISTVSFQSLKAANTHPINSLRNE